MLINLLPPRRGHPGRSRPPPVRSPRPSTTAARRARPDRRRAWPLWSKPPVGSPRPPTATARDPTAAVSWSKPPAAAWLLVRDLVGAWTRGHDHPRTHRRRRTGHPGQRPPPPSRARLPAGRRRRPRPRRDDGHNNSMDDKNSIALCVKAAVPRRCPVPRLPPQLLREEREKREERMRCS
jgi:hypothetical protein